MASLWILAILLYTCICRIQAEDGTIRFLVLGDWGGKPKKPYYTKSEDDIAEQMGKVASGINANFTIVVGDNFYEDGVTDVDDPRFKETFEVKGQVLDGYVWRRPPSKKRAPSDHNGYI